MHQIIQQITDHFVSRLPGDSESYQIEDLSKYGYPSFLIKKIHIDLEQRLKEAISYPKTPLFNSEAESVRQAWQLFEKAVDDELQLPVEYTEKVTNNAVTEVLNILLQPRKNIPNILFEENKILSDRTLINRARHITVYQHFAQVLVGYMERKGRTKLSKEKCRDIIINIDEKLTRGYTSSQWAQILEPLFEIAGKQVDSKLFRIFFEDKKMDRTARYFELKNESLTREELIEVLSSPELLNLEGYGSASSEKFYSKFEQKNSVGISPLQRKAEIESDEAKKRQDLHDQLTAEAQKNTDKENTEVKQRKESASIEESTDETDNKNESSKTGFNEAKLNDGVNKSTNFNSVFLREKKSDSKKRSLNEIFATQKNAKEQDSTEHTVTTNISQIESPKSTGKDEQNNKQSSFEAEKETPIWKRFIGAEEAENEVKSQDENQSVNDSVSSISEHTDVHNPKKKLEQKLQDKKTYFIEEIFDGSELAYESSLAEIASKNTWKSASKLVENKIFDRNSVNIYSQSAVDFTDRLQSYFIEKQNINK